MIGTQTAERYSSEVAELWTGLARSLSQLDRLAAEPELLATDAGVERLQRLQYALHVAAEDAYGLEPPAGAESTHSELAVALEGARDATAEVAEALADQGRDGIEPLLHEWRGTLFRVRLARLRLAAPRPADAVPPEVDVAHDLARPLAAALLALAGALAFAGGAALGDWPVWTAGIAAATAAVVVYRT